jgi:hypothetical protein
MKITALCLLVLGTMPLLGCGTKKDASKKNFSEALDVYLAKMRSAMPWHCFEMANRYR